MSSARLAVPRAGWCRFNLHRFAIEVIVDVGGAEATAKAQGIDVNSVDQALFAACSYSSGERTRLGRKLPCQANTLKVRLLA